ncbi:MAG: hypothetical protein ACRELW_22880 [Candidatus Rokuibacteriota bacterium]
MLHFGAHRGCQGLPSDFSELIVVDALVILVAIAVFLGGFSLLAFLRLQREQRRAPWKRETGMRDSRRLERRAFAIGVGALLALVAGLVAIQMARRTNCSGQIVIAKGPDGTKRECICERGRRGACFDPGP